MLNIEHDYVYEDPPFRLLRATFSSIAGVISLLVSKQLTLGDLSAWLMTYDHGMTYSHKKKSKRVKSLDLGSPLTDPPPDMFRARKIRRNEVYVWTWNVFGIPSEHCCFIIKLPH